MKTVYNMPHIQIKTVYNISRKVARTSSNIPENTIWISIEEPDVETSTVNNIAWSNLPKLTLQFWDVTEPLVLPDYTANPVTEEQVNQILEFLLKYPDYDVIVNCAAGVSRSGAIAQFCQDILLYNWDNTAKRRATPNHLLYRMLVNQYQIKNEI
jgi:predicted protein tyrosine phosphatase